MAHRVRNLDPPIRNVCYDDVRRAVDKAGLYPIFLRLDELLRSGCGGNVTESAKAGALVAKALRRSVLGVDFNWEDRRHRDSPSQRLEADITALLYGLHDDREHGRVWGQGRFDKWAELMRLDMPRCAFTEGFESRDLERLPDDGMRRLFFEGMTLRIAYRLNEQALAKIRKTKTDLPVVDQLNSGWLVAHKDEPDYPIKTFRELFRPRLEEEGDPKSHIVSGVVGLSFDPLSESHPIEGRLDDFLLKTGIRQIDLNAMELRQKLGRWYDMLKDVAGFLGHRPELHQPPLPGLFEPGEVEAVKSQGYLFDDMKPKPR
jgi:hypothetical protein